MVFFTQIDVLTYADYLSLKDRLHKARYTGVIDDIWLITSHNPGAFTIGRSHKSDSLIRSRSEIMASGREFYEIDRGGDITYHGPSQVMVYPFIEVPEKDVELLVRKIEDVVIELLKIYELDGVRNPGFPGVWCNGGKIASIGLAIRKWITYHGLAFNHEKDDGGFEMIIPCGIKGIRMTSLEEEIESRILRNELIENIIKSINHVFKINLKKIELIELENQIMTRG